MLDCISILELNKVLCKLVPTLNQRAKHTYTTETSWLLINASVGAVCDSVIRVSCESLSLSLRQMSNIPLAISDAIRTPLLREARRRADLANRPYIHVCDIPPHPEVTDSMAEFMADEENRSQEQRLGALSKTWISFQMAGDV